MYTIYALYGPRLKRECKIARIWKCEACKYIVRIKSVVKLNA